MLADGGEAEEPVTEPANIAPLAARMLEVVRRDGREMLLANLLLQSRGLVEDAQSRVPRIARAAGLGARRSLHLGLRRGSRSSARCRYSISFASSAI